MHDVLITNARIWTNDVGAPWAEAALVRDGRFIAAGRASDIHAPPAAHVIDCGGRLVLPGFTDAHAHLMGTGFAMTAVDLKGVPSIEEAVGRVAERARTTAPGAWITGTGWDQHLWPGGRFPDRRQLDAVAPDNPAFLDHASGHCAWVNSAALKAAGLTRATESPAGGAIDHDDAGEPIGILRDHASRLVADAIPRRTQRERIAALEAAIAHAHRLGVTGVHAMNVGRGEFQTLHALNDAGRLRLRVRAFLSHDRLDEWIERNVATGDGDDMLRIGGVKFFADGALGSLTAWMFEPYEGAGDVGFPLQPPEDLERDVRRGLEHGLAPAVHAIGDRANHAVLDIYERLRSVAPHLPRRIEHAQLLTGHDVPRFGKLGVFASMQPVHATQDMAKVDRWWGERAAGAYRFASLTRSGALLAFGSDTPVETMDPLAGIHAAVMRKNAKGEPAGGWQTQERISIEDALRAYTSGAAGAVGDGSSSPGRVAPGHHADFVVISHDLFGLSDPMRILDARVVLTAVSGEIVFRSPDL